MVYVFMLIGLVGLVGGVLGARAAYVRIKDMKLSWWRVQIVPLLGSAALAVALSLTAYPYPFSDTATIVGIPFPVAAFVNGFDYTGPATIPMFLANLVFFLLLPQPFLAWSLRARSRHGDGR